MQRWMRVLARLWTMMLASIVVSLLGGLSIRWLAPVSPWVTAPTVQLRDPLPQSQAVPPRSTITLAFSTPMNPFTVARALRIDPPLAGSFEWSDDMQILRFVPAQPLQPATSYRVQVMANAQSRWWRPLAQPLDVAFTTAAQPAIVAALAPRLRDAPIALVFSQPMVAASAVGQPASLQYVQLAPPWPLEGQWLDPQTLLLQPVIAFTAATTYTLTLDANLRDARGIELGQPFRWHFATPWPALIAQTPPPGERWVNPQQPLTLVFDAPIDTRLLSAAVTITPAISGDFSSATTDGRYTVTFTPYNGWTPGQTYHVRLQPPSANQPLAEWRFTVEPEPALVASFPGQGQTLAPGQEIRLIFSTPMEDAELRSGLRFDPPVTEVELQVDENRVNLRPALQAATTYTLTVAAGTRDRSGVPLAEDVSLTIRTASAPPLLHITSDPIISFPADAQPAVTLERMNVSTVDAQLYQLDATTLVRAISRRPTEWSSFVPERYGQPLVRAWRETFYDPPDTVMRSLLPLATNSAGDPLPAGAYYLRLTTGNGLRVDRLILISALHLTMLPNGNEVLLWVTSSGNGAPVSNVAVSVYAGETMLARGNSNEQGLWRIKADALGLASANAPARTLIALAESNGIALAREDITTILQPRTQALLMSDRLSYRPGGTVRISGVVRERQADGRLSLPAARTCDLQLDGQNVLDEPRAVVCTVNENGRLNGSLQLDARTAPGWYTVRVSVGDTTYAIPIRVSVPATGATARVIPIRPAGLAVDVTRADLPVSGAVVSWTLRIATLATAELDGVDGEVTGATSETQASAVTDASGRAVISLPADENLLRPLRYTLHLTVELPDGEQIERTTEGVITPRSPRLAITMPAVIERNERASVTTTLRTADGQPIANTLVEIELRRNAAEPSLLIRRVRTGADGQATAELVTLAPGRYELTARAGTALTRKELWVAGSSIGTAEPRIIADRPTYAVGDVARLLFTGPSGGGTALVIVGQGENALVRQANARPGNLITIPISADMAPVTAITALIDDGVRVWKTATTIQIDPPPAPFINLTQREALPGATIPITVTAATDDLLVMLKPIHAPPTNLDRWNRSLLPGQPAVGTPSSLAGIDVLASVQSSNNQHEITVRLPNQQGRWRLEVIAIDPAGIASSASTLIDTSQPVEAIATPLPALRPADTALATLILRNVDGQERTIRARLWLSGGVLLDPFEQTVRVPAGATAPVFWQVQANASIIGLRYEVIDSVSLPPIEYAVPVRKEAQLPATAQTWVTASAIELTLPDGDNDVAIAASARAALADQAQQLLQTATPTAEALAAAVIIGRMLERTAATNAEAEEWRALNDRALTQLRALRNSDGGWGWWPGSGSDPFVTSFVLEAIGQAEPASRLRELSEPALAYLHQRRLAQPADAQAYTDYVMAIYGERTGQPALPAGAGPAGRAFTALSATTEQSALLAPLLNTASSGLPWAGADGMPPSAVAVSASVVQALATERPADPRLAPWRAALLRQWQGNGWPTPYEAARVALALGPTLLDGNARVRVEHDTADLTAERPISGVERFRLGGGTLRVEPTNGTALIAVRNPASSAGQPGAVRARLRYRTDTEPSAIDQPVEIELLLIVSEPIFRLEAAIPLPAGITPVKVDAGASFAYQQIDREWRQVQLGGTAIAPGVYRVIITAQAAIAGTFAIPPAMITAPGSDIAPVVAFTQEMITIEPAIR
ncbi:Ig-like domain-containing alpha-2-macroglobulin family protein [Chloroflexus sp.]|uniref:Ig-like domain-containing alpha-2-macroglobulin family protein n=1 Tax=Chloroflexus sp. TaxID=1904827 RepID=UPI002ACD9181|nr:Ig-like domain-containing protein [Chloroflexus sp.]